MIVGLIVLVVIGIVIALIKAEPGKQAESAAVGGVMGLIVFAGILLFVVLPFLLMSSC